MFNFRSALMNYEFFRGKEKGRNGDGGKKLAGFFFV